MDILALNKYGLNDIIEDRNVIEKSEEKFRFLEKFDEHLGVKTPKKIDDFTI